MSRPVAIITGGDAGIGRASAVELARQGFEVGITWLRSLQQGEATLAECREHGAGTALTRLDLTEADTVAPAIEALADQLGGLDAYVGNAGTGHADPFLELELETWRRVLEVNLTGAFVAAQAASRRMVRDGTRGRIVLVTSVHEHIPHAGAAAYSAAKGGLGLLVKTMAVELAERGITVNAVAPGEIATAMTGNEHVDPHMLKRPGIPLGRPGDAREIGSAVAFLVSDGAGYLTGHSLVVDGGLLLMAGEANRMASG